MNYFYFIVGLISGILSIKACIDLYKEVGAEFDQKYLIPKLANIKNKEIYDIYIGRVNSWLNLEESIWHNPFKFYKESDREDSLQKYEDYLRNNPLLLSKLKFLSGKTLGCYCSPDKKCHGDIIIKLYKEIGLKEFRKDF